MGQNPPVHGVLKTIRLFSELEDRELDRIAEAGRLRRYESGEVVIERGDPPEALYGVSVGRLKVVTPRPEGRDATLHILGPGDVFGEVAMFHPAGRSARITALEDSVLLILEQAVFLELLEHSPTLVRRLLALMAERLYETINHFDTTTSLDVPQRIAKKVLLLAEHFGAPTEDGIGLTIKLSQTDLGELADTTRQTVNRTLRSWTEAGLIRSQDGSLVILDMERLRAQAEQSSGG